MFAEMGNFEARKDCKASVDCAGISSSSRMPFLGTETALFWAEKPCESGNSRYGFSGLCMAEFLNWSIISQLIHEALN